MIWAAIQALLGIGGKAIDRWQEKVQREADAAARILEAETLARIRLAERAQAGEIEWDLSAVEQMKFSWKDEWFTLLLSVPLILAFCGPTARAWTKEGFGALAEMPQWYQVSLGVAIAASFGYRKLVDLMAAWRGGK